MGEKIATTTLSYEVTTMSEYLEELSTLTELSVSDLSLMFFAGALVAALVVAVFVAVSLWIVLFGIFAAPLRAHPPHCHECAVERRKRNQERGAALARWLRRLPGRFRVWPGHTPARQATP